MGGGPEDKAESCSEETCQDIEVGEDHGAMHVENGNYSIGHIWGCSQRGYRGAAVATHEEDGSQGVWTYAGTICDGQVMD